MNIVLLNILVWSVVAIVAFYGVTTRWWRHKSGQSLFGVLGALMILLIYVLFIRYVEQPTRMIIANILVSLLIGASWYMLYVMVKERYFRKDK